MNKCTIQHGKKNYILLDHTSCSHIEGSNVKVHHARQNISEKAVSSDILVFADRI